MNSHKSPIILFLFPVAVFFAGCEQNHIDSSINLSVSPPTQIDSRSLPTVCSDHSRADISIDNRLIGTLEKQENSDNWHGSFQVPSGKHSIGIRFVCVLNSFAEISLATSSQEYDSSSGNNIEFTSNDYILPDNDKNSEPNITALVNGTDPGPEPSAPITSPIRITQENWREIYTSSMESVRYITSTSFAAIKSNCVNSGSMQQTPGTTDEGFTLTNYVFHSCLSNGIRLKGDLGIRQPVQQNSDPNYTILTSQNLVITNDQEKLTAFEMQIGLSKDASDWRQDINVDLTTYRGRIRITTEEQLAGRFLDTYPDTGTLSFKGENSSSLNIFAATGSNEDAGINISNGTSTTSETVLWSELGWELIRLGE